MALPVCIIHTFDFCNVSVKIRPIQWVVISYSKIELLRDESDPLLSTNNQKSCVWGYI